MKILIDENLPKKIKHDFPAAMQVYTVHDLGWSGKKNGELLKLIKEEDFNVFITADSNLQYQQNLKNLSVAIYILKSPSNNYLALKAFIPLILKQLSGYSTGIFEIKL